MVVLSTIVVIDIHDAILSAYGLFPRGNSEFRLRSIPPYGPVGRLL